MAGSALDNIYIILVGTKHPGNIGSVARALHNTGISHLRLAAPQCSINEESFRFARSGGPILESTRAYRSAASALRGIGLVAGTTGKTGGNRSQAYPPHALAPRLIAQAAAQKVGILFGPEDTGLVDGDITLCGALIRIPTPPAARSINIAQAVMIVCYELFLASLERPPERVPRLARLEQVEAMYRQLEESLRRIGFLNDKTARHMMFALRRLLGRAGLEETDVAILRGIARQIAWYAGRTDRDLPAIPRCK
jgi:tRNA/rRNA methyltransferase